MTHYLTGGRLPPMRVVSFDKVTHQFVGEFADGSRWHDPNFWPELVKRAGYTLTTEVPKEFHHA